MDKLTKEALLEALADYDAQRNHHREQMLRCEGAYLATKSLIEAAYPAEAEQP